MKKFLYLLLAVPFLALMAACSDDDKDLPDVKISIDYSGATDQDGILYIAQGETLTINSITATPANGGGKAMLGNTVYSIDGVPVYSIGVSPYGGNLDTSSLEVGTHQLSFFSQVFQVDKEVGFALYGFNFVVTEPNSTPEGGTGTVTPQVRIQDHGE